MWRLVRELEKKFSGKHVVFIAQRRILPKPTRKANKLKQKRPRSRTLLAVHNSILDDLVYPAEIVGKRIRIRLDGSRLFKVIKLMKVDRSTYLSLVLLTRNGINAMQPFFQRIKDFKGSSRLNSIVIVMHPGISLTVDYCIGFVVDATLATLTGAGNIVGVCPMNYQTLGNSHLQIIINISFIYRIYILVSHLHLD